jgi:Flp pilus assembly protein TadD/peroxiredoxin
VTLNLIPIGSLHAGFILPTVFNDLDAVPSRLLVSVPRRRRHCLKRKEKTRRPPELPLNSGRRDFLLKGASAALWPYLLRDFSFSAGPPPAAPGASYHLHPHYASQRPLDALLLKAGSGLDEFITEKYADQIVAILGGWSASLLQSPQQLESIGRSLSANFQGSALRSAQSRAVRAWPPVEVVHRAFPSQTGLDRDAFLAELRDDLGSCSKFFAADFQVTAISAEPTKGEPGRLHTRILYEVVGTGPGLYREQRVGNWDLTWEFDPSGKHRIQRWQVLGETRSHSRTPIFADITAQALGASPSYSTQLLRGTDYWRTVLDGATAIDVYGHNGVSVGDIDNDGFDDLYICQPAGLPNRLYRNRGDGTFEDITESAGVGVLENTACALFADIDNDGRQDLVVVRATGPLLFMNQGKGKFRARPDAFTFATPPQGTFTGAAIADYDRDGWLDIYFCLYVYYQGTDQYKYPVPYYDANNGPPNFLLHNNRDGTFVDVTQQTGLDRNNTRYSFACAWSNYDNDGWPDLYVVNDFGRKNLYRNNGDGTFTDVADQAGVEDIGAGMSVAWLDYNNDGADDLYVANMWTAAGERVASQDIFKPSAPEAIRRLYRKHAMGNSLFETSSPPWPSVSSVVKGSSSTAEYRGTHGEDPRFQDATGASGVGHGRWSWSSDAFDFDHDGYPDLYIANGMVSGPDRDDLNSFFWRQVVAKSPDEPKPSRDYEQGWSAINELIRADGTWSGYERNVFFANNRDGTLSDVSGAVGLDFREDGRSFAIADFDHDGRQEIFLKNRNAPVLRILKNMIEDLSPSISFRLQGTKSNRDAIGAVVTIETDTGRQQRSVQAGSGFLSQHGKEVFFGLGASKGKVQATIHWPSGLTQPLHDLPPNHRVWVEEGSAPSRVQPFKPRIAGSTVEERPFRASPEPVEGAASSAQVDGLQPRWHDAPLPATIETWLLSPVAAPDISLPDQSGQVRALSALRGKPVLLNFWTADSPQCQADIDTFSSWHFRWSAQGLHLLTVTIDRDEFRPAHTRTFPFAVLRANDDVTGIYNIFFRQLFDRHRDMPLPTSFLIDERGDVVKVYQGPLNGERVAPDVQQIPRTSADRLKLALPFPGITDAADFPRNYLSYGSLFFQRGYYEQAGAAFARAAHDDPESAEAQYGLGSVYLNQHKLREARAAFERAVKLRASFPDTLANAWNNLGLIDARAGQTAQAIAYFRRALELSPDHVVALVNLGSAYRQLHQWDDARRAYEHALTASPDDPEANYGAGMVAASTAAASDDNRRAEQYLLRAIELRPVYPEALNNLGILYLRTQRRDQAVARFEDCIRVAPTFDQAYLNLARVYVIEGTKEKARVVLENLLKQRPGHAEAEKMIEQLQP